MAFADEALLAYHRYAFQALSVNEFRDATFEPSNPPSQRDMQGNTFLAREGFSNVSIVDNCIYLAIMLGVFNLMALVILVLRRPTFMQLRRAEKVE